MINCNDDLKHDAFDLIHDLLFTLYGPGILYSKENGRQAINLTSNIMASIHSLSRKYQN